MIMYIFSSLIKTCIHNYNYIYMYMLQYEWYVCSSVSRSDVQTVSQEEEDGLLQPGTAARLGHVHV